MRNKITGTIPCLEHPTRCYLSAFNKGVRIISCTPKGQIITTKNRRLCEEWYMLDGESEYIQFKNCAHDYLLVSHPRNDCISTINPSSSSDGIEDSFWRVKESSCGNNSFSFCGVRSGRYLTCQENGDLCGMIVGDDDDDHNNNDQGCVVTTWDGEFLTGELCFISSPNHRDMKVSCHAWGGKLKMYNTWQGWEVWRFIEAGDGHVRIMSWHDNHILCSNKFGKVWTTDNLQGDWEKWEVELGPDGTDGVIIKSVSHGRYLQVGNCNEISTRDNINASTSIWHITAANRKNFYISSVAHDKRIACGKNKIFSTSNRKGWEVWNLQYCEKGYVRLYSKAHQASLSSDQYGNLYHTSSVNENSLWELQISPTNGIQLMSKNSCRFLSCNEDGKKFSTRSKSEPGNSEVFNLEPVLPATLTGAQLIHITIGGIVAALNIITAPPIAVVGVIGAIVASKDRPSRGERAAIDAQIGANRPFCGWRSW